MGSEFGWGWVWLALVTGLAAGFVVTTVLWGKNVTDHAAAFDAGWKSAAAVLTVLATFITVRRLRLSERQHRDEVHDATERRITDLYTKAVDQLGSEKSAVRLGGLYALERLAQGNSEHRQTIVDVICAYLRSPSPGAVAPGAAAAAGVAPGTAGAGPGAGTAVPADGAAAPDDDDLAGLDDPEEREVRLAAQRILVRHLRRFHREPRPYTRESFWPGIHIYLEGAILIDFDFSACETGHASFYGSIFRGDTTFDDAEIGDTEFSNALFYGDTSFRRTTFQGEANFRSAIFRRKAEFTRSTFSKHACFKHANFCGNADFSADCLDGVTFDGATFNGPAGYYGMAVKAGISFDNTIFNKRVIFAGSRFEYYVHFKDVNFNDEASFTDIVFVGDEVLFDRAKFRGAVKFDEVIFDVKTDFTWVRFGGNVSFEDVAFGEHATYGGSVSFEDSVFSDEADFLHVKIHDGAWFQGAVFNCAPSFRLVEIRNLDRVRNVSTWPEGYQPKPDAADPNTAMLVKAASAG